MLQWSDQLHLQVYFNGYRTSEKQQFYNDWVKDKNLEDYSFRYMPQRFRKWSEFTIGNTALGGISFLALEAIGATMALAYGFTNAFYAILFASVIIFLAGIPVYLQTNLGSICLIIFT
jgi:hypothetical protein